MVTESLPFLAEHPAEMIHAHLARILTPPRDTNKTIPASVSNIIITLLEKVPESRYQSAHGLKEDLQRCLYQHNETGVIDSFTLKENDNIRVYESATKLYGREETINQLIDGFERVRQGGIECIFVHGPSGIGKTVLVNELHKPLIRSPREADPICSSHSSISSINETNR